MYIYRADIIAQITMRYLVVLFCLLLPPPALCSGVTVRELENQRWIITSYFDGTTLRVSKIFQGLSEGRSFKTVMPYMSFSHGNLVGSPGCALLAGKYTEIAGKLHMSVKLTIAGNCLQANTQIEAICRALTGVRVARKNGDRIELSDDTGRTQVLLSH